MPEVAEASIQLSEAETQRWLSLIDKGKNERKAFYQGIRRRRALLRSEEAYKALVDDQEAIWINLLWSIVKTKLPQLYYRNPTVRVTPRRARSGTNPAPQDLDRKRAKNLEDVTRYELEEIDFKAEAKMAVKDGILDGLGVLQVFYTPILDTLPDPLSTRDMATLGVLSEDYTAPTTMAVDEYVRDEKVGLVRVDPLDVIVDPRSRRGTKDAAWIALQRDETVEDLLSNPDYENVEELLRQGSPDKQGTRKSGTTDQSSTGETWSGDDTIRTYAVYDLKHSRYMVLAEGGKLPLQVKDWPWMLDGYPLIFLELNPDSTDWNPISEFQAYWDQIIQTSDVASSLLDIQKRSGTVVGYDENASDDFKDALKDGGALRLLPCKGNPKEQLHSFDLHGNRRDDWDVLSMLREDVRQVSGVTEYMQGTRSAGVETATEANLITQGGNARLTEEADVVADFITKTLRKLCQLIRQYYSAETASKILGQSIPVEEWPWGVPAEVGTPEFDRIREELRADLDVQIEPYSSQPKNLAVEKKQLMELLQVLLQLQPALNAMGFQINLALPIRNLIDKYDMRDLGDLIIPMPPDPASLMPGGGMGAPAGAPGGSAPGGGVGVTSPTEEAISGEAGKVSGGAGKLSQSAPFNAGGQ